MIIIRYYQQYIIFNIRYGEQYIMISYKSLLWSAY